MADKRVTITNPIIRIAAVAVTLSCSIHVLAFICGFIVGVVEYAGY